MQYAKATFLAIFLFACTISYSQMEFPSFGSFSAEDIRLKQCSFDPEAEAIILFDKAVVNHDDNYQMITERRIRIKILNEKGIDRANIVIPFYHKDDFEFLSKIQAYTFNTDAAGMQPGLVVEKNRYILKSRTVIIRL